MKKEKKKTTVSTMYEEEYIPSAITISLTLM
jgi:hypothetical protein